MGARLFCCLIMHLTNIQEVKTSLQIMEYLKNHRVRNESMCLYICLMKYVATCLAEYCMVYVICKSDGIQDVIKDFVCLGCIIELDNLFASTNFTVEEIDASIETELFLDGKDEEIVI